LRVSIRAVAEKCDVSRQTVSSALTNTGRVAPETRARILQVAQEMGYRPNSIARTMKSGRFGTIALLLSSKDGRGWMPDSLLDHVHDELALHDLHLTGARLPDEVLLSERGVPRLLREWSCDGLLINYIYDIPRQLLELIEQYSIPAIWINTKQQHDCVYPDDETAAYQLTKHILQLGHRRIAIVHYPKYAGVTHYSDNDRVVGYRRAMKEAGFAPEIIGEHGGFDYENMIDFSFTWLRDKKRPSAIIALSLVEAAAITQAAAMIGVKIPQELSVATFSFGSVIEHSAQMTYMQLPHELGNVAVQMLMGKMAAPTKPLLPQAVPAKLVKGITCGPPST
jgi:LacI family transcriptional regulator